MWPNPQFTEETINGKLHFLCNVMWNISRYGCEKVAENVKNLNRIYVMNQ